MKTKSCIDCGTDTECQWCEVCIKPVCDECDPLHDCLSEHVPTEADLDADGEWIDEIQDDEDDSGHA